MADWERVSLTEVDESLSGRLVDTPLWNIYFRLSETPSPTWVDFLEAAWSATLYSNKRAIKVREKHLVILSTPIEEVEMHLPHIKKAMERANEAEAQQIAQFKGEEKAAALQAGADRVAFREMVDRLRL